MPGGFLLFVCDGGILGSFGSFGLAGGFLLLTRPINKKALPREMSMKSSFKPFFCFFLLDSLSGLGGLHFNVTFSANLNSLANSRTSLWGSMEGGQVRDSISGSQDFSACSKALIP